MVLEKNSRLLYLTSVLLVALFATTLLSLSEQAIAQTKNLLTEYDALLFATGYPRDIYLYNLESGELDLVAHNAGSQLSASPNGQWVAFDAEDNLYIVDIDDADLVRITDDGIGANSLSWSPDGHHLAYIQPIPPSAWYGNLHILNITTFESKQINSNELVVGSHSVHWLPNSRQFLFRAYERPLDPEEMGDDKFMASIRFDLYLGDNTGKEPINLTNGLGDIVGSFSSPDGQTIIFASATETQTLSGGQVHDVYDYAVFLMNLESRKTVEVMRLLLEPRESPLGWGTYPWSPDGEWVLLPYRLALPDTLRAIRPDGTLHHEIIRLSPSWGQLRDVGINAFTVMLSPDGKTVAGGGRFEKDGNECLCAVDSDGNHFRVIVPDVFVVQLIWSPDSRSIFFKYAETADSADYHYGIVNVDGTGFYDPFAHLPEKLSTVENVHWAHLLSPTPTPAPTATVTVPTSSNPAVCTTAGLVILILVSALWLARPDK